MFINKKLDIEGEVDSKEIRRRTISFRNNADGSDLLDLIWVSRTTPEYLIVCEEY